VPVMSRTVLTQGMKRNNMGHSILRFYALHNTLVLYLTKNNIFHIKEALKIVTERIKLRKV
jgi:hypothetical protein